MGFWLLLQLPGAAGFSSHRSQLQMLVYTVSGTSHSVGGKHTIPATFPVTMDASKPTVGHEQQGTNKGLARKALHLQVRTPAASWRLPTLPWASSRALVTPHASCTVSLGVWKSSSALRCRNMVSSPFSFSLGGTGLTPLPFLCPQTLGTPAHSS